MVELRDYQKQGIRQIFEAWDPKRGNHKKVLFQMPTGTGKTTVFSHIVKKASNKNVLIIVHREELVEQIADRLFQFGIENGYITSKRERNETLNVQVATIQTLTRRKFPPAEIVIIDECHHSKASSYKLLWQSYPDAWFLGVTATPYRLNGEGFEDQFDILIILGKLSYFFENGHLARLRHMVCGIPDLSKVKSKMNDYDIQMLHNVMLDNKIMASLTESYIKHTLGKRMIVFAVDIEHSKEIVQRYQAKGISAAHLDARTSKSDRKNILDAFRRGEILVLSNVDIVSEGFDVPACEVVQLARPTKSLSLYLQQVGRCMRPIQGKEYGVVLDNAGLWLEHGLSYIDREWSLKDRKTFKSSTKLPHPGSKYATLDEYGTFKPIFFIEEVEGLELVDLSEEIKHFIRFEHFLQIAIDKGYKVNSAIYNYTQYLFENRIYMTDNHINYGHKRALSYDSANKLGFWIHRKNLVNSALKEERISLE